MNKQIRRVMLQLGIEPMIKTDLHDQCSNHRAVEEHPSGTSCKQDLKILGQASMILLRSCKVKLRL